MKKTIGILVCILMLSTLCACGANDDTSLQSSNESSLQTSDESSLQDGGEISLQNGNYYAEGDYEELKVPSVYLDAETKAFSFTYGDIFSNAYKGTYEIKGKCLLATCNGATIEFHISDNRSLYLKSSENADWMTLPVGTSFVFSTETK